jgi:signal transduction histidine kinase
VAKRRYPVLSLPHSVSLLLTPEQNKALPERLKKRKTFSLPLPASGMELVFMPVETYWIAQLIVPLAEPKPATNPEGLENVLLTLNANFRLPLSKIFSDVASLARTGDATDNPELVELAEEINEAGYRLMQFTQNITTYLRCLYGVVPPPTTTIDVRALLSELLPAAVLTMQKTGVTISEELPLMSVYIVADPNGIEQIVSHLIANSCRYTRPGNRITVRLETVDNFAKISVIDRGAGIPADRLSQVLEPFGAWGYDEKGREKGGGLGLTVVQHLVSLYNGTLSITSQEGVGTTVVIRLPLTQKPDDDDDAEAKRSVDYVRSRYSPLQLSLSDTCGAPMP